MAAKKSPFAGLNLSEQVVPARDQRLFQNSERQPANQPTSQPDDVPTRQEANPQAAPLANQLTSQQVSKQKSLRQLYPKKTYHLSEVAITQLEDMQLALKRKHGVKRPLIEEIVELAIQNLYDDFEANQGASKLVSKLTS